jgi:hypothetical protein
MTDRSSFQTLCVVACLAFAIALPVSAQTLYDDGPINGHTDAWTINFGFVVNDSFTISSGSSTITGLSFGAWLSPGDVLQSTEVLLTSEPSGGTIYFDQQVNVTASGCYVNQLNYQICTETASFNGPTLGNGTYWLGLENAVDTEGSPVFWDENSGIGCQSQGCPSQACEGNCIGSIPAESFSVLGTSTGTSSVPEPESLVLFASGFLAVCGILRRKLL